MWLRYVVVRFVCLVCCVMSSGMFFVALCVHAKLFDVCVCALCSCGVVCCCSTCLVYMCCCVCVSFCFVRVCIACARLACDVV